MRSTQDKIADLTNRETEALSLLAIGASTKEIARLMGIGYKTADQHLARCRQKLDVRKSIRLARVAIRAGLSDVQVA